METLPKEDVSCYTSVAQQEVLSRISELDVISKNFFMTGGTTLAVFYLHHRLSEDIDLFSIHYNDLNPIDVALGRIFRNDLATMQSSSGFSSYLIKGVKVDIVFDPLSIPVERPAVHLKTGNIIVVDTMGNIASNKLSAVVSRTEAKDMIDLYFIASTVWADDKKEKFLKCYDQARKKEALFDDPATASYQMEELFRRVLREKEACLPPLKKPVHWPSFEEDMRFYIDILYHMEEWL